MVKWKIKKVTEDLEFHRGSVHDMHQKLEEKLICSGVTVEEFLNSTVDGMTEEFGQKLKRLGAGVERSSRDTDRAEHYTGMGLENSDVVGYVEGRGG